jgi:hypothetical protein
MLFLLGQPFDPRRLDGRVNPEVCAMMRGRRVVGEEDGVSLCDTTPD